jgi:hypothetical protein
MPPERQLISRLSIAEPRPGPHQHYQRLPNIALRQLVADSVDLVAVEIGWPSQRPISVLAVRFLDAFWALEAAGTRPDAGHFHAPAVPKRVIGRSLASFLRFWAVAASKNSSLAPLGPRNLRRLSLRIRLRWANSISTFFLRCLERS